MQWLPLLTINSKGDGHVLRILPIWRMAFSLGTPDGDGLSYDERLGLPIWPDGTNALLPGMGRISRYVTIW
jgi:hypothetical protein